MKSKNINKVKKLLLTGLGGSIGIHTMAHIFHKTDWEIVGTDSFKHKGWTDRVNEMLEAHPEWKKRLTIITHDLIAPFSEMTKRKMGRIDYIISMAALSDVEASIQDPVSFIQNNVAITLNMLEYAREVKPEVFILISTDETVGPTNGDGKGHKEWAVMVPSNPYSASKACSESIAVSYWRTYGVPVIITRTMNNFGEMQQGSKYPVMIQKWINKGKEVTIHGTKNNIGSRFYIHSRNKADALLFILKNLPPYMHQDGEVDRPDMYNIVGDKRINNLELAQIIAKMMGKKLKYKLVDIHATRPGHDRHYGLDGTKLKKLGWKLPVSFEDSMRETVEWQQKHPEWLK